MSVRTSDQLAGAPLRWNQHIAVGGQNADESIAVAVIRRSCRRRLSLPVMLRPDVMELAHHGIICKLLFLSLSIRPLPNELGYTCEVVFGR